MRSRIPLLVLLFAVGSFAVPLAAHASSIPFFGPIIPDAYKACAAGWGLLIEVVNNIIRLLITLAILFVAPIMIAWSGFLFVTNPVDSGGISKAKGILTHTIVGIVIALAGWMIVDALMAVLYSGSEGSTKWGTWSQLITSGGVGACIQQEGTAFVPGTVPVPPPAVSVVQPGVAPASEAAIRAQFASAGVGINHPQPCSPYDTNGVTGGCTNVGNMRPNTVSQVIALKNACSGCALMITGGSENGHASGNYSHGAGYKVDLGLNASLNSYLQSMTPSGTRSGGEPGPIYKDRCGQNEYVLASNHWDITIYSVCNPPK